MVAAWSYTQSYTDVFANVVSQFCFDFQKGLPPLLLFFEFPYIALVLAAAFANTICGRSRSGVRCCDAGALRACRVRGERVGGGGLLCCQTLFKNPQGEQRQKR